MDEYKLIRIPALATMQQVCNLTPSRAIVVYGYVELSLF